MWSLTLREDRRSRMFANAVVNKIFGPKTEEVIGGWEKLDNNELRNAYFSPMLIK
jgi:hypothetical protein